MILGHTVFKLLSASIFSLKLSLQLNNSISWQWLLFHLIKTSHAKYNQVIKPGYGFIKIYTKRLSCRLHLKLFFEKVTSHSYDYVTSLLFFARFSTTLSDGQESWRTCSIPIIERLWIITTKRFWRWLTSLVSGVKVTVSWFKLSLLNC